jgi:hypothetical protein
VDEINQIGHLRLFVLTMTMKMSVVATVRGNRHWVARAGATLAGQALSNVGRA